MIDKLVLHIPFKTEYIQYLRNLDDDDHGYIAHCDLLGVKFVGDIEYNPDGILETTNLRTKFESLPSSHSGLAFKIYDEGMNTAPFALLKCSPAKLLQGHNLCGFDDIKFSALNMLALLGSQCEEVFNMLDIPQTVVSEMDVTYSILTKNHDEKMAILDFLSNVSNGQTKSRGDSYQTSIYFGAKNSRIKKLKIYSKLEEMINDSKDMFKKGYEKSAAKIMELTQTEYAKKALRLEATLRKRYFQRNNIPTKLTDLITYIEKRPNFYTDAFNDAWKDIFKALEGQEIKIMNDKNVYDQLYKAYSKITKTGNISTAKVDRLNNFYITLKNSGYSSERQRAKQNGPSSMRMFNRNIKDLVECGISKSVLQNLFSDHSATIIPFPRFFTIDFSQQHYEGYEYPKSLFDEELTVEDKIFSIK